MVMRCSSEMRNNLRIDKFNVITLCYGIRNFFTAQEQA